jgi:hypothetical protein
MTTFNKLNVGDKFKWERPDNLEICIKLSDTTYRTIDSEKIWTIDFRYTIFVFRV